MNKNLLEQLRKFTVVVADTGDFQSIREFSPRDGTTNPALIAAAARRPEYKSIVDETLGWARTEAGSPASRETVLSLAFDRLAVAFGVRILSIIPGRVSTEVDARLSYDTEATVERGRRLIALYRSAGVDTSRVLIKIAATWEGIQAAERLEREGIHCNLTLLFGLHQAVACAEAGVTLISPFVGRILDWYKKNTGQEFSDANDPGVASVKTIYQYYKKHGYSTEIMGASFRTLGEILELAGIDLLTVSPTLLAELHAGEGDVVQKLDPEQARQIDIPRIAMDYETFERMHAADRMASDNLRDGIAGFVKAIHETEALLAERLAQLEG